METVNVVVSAQSEVKGFREDISFQMWFIQHKERKKESKRIVISEGLIQCSCLLSR